MSNQSSSTSPSERLSDLRDLRIKLIAATETAEPSALPALARELRLVTAEIEEIEPAREASVVDDLAAKRAVRRAGANQAGSSASGG